MLGAREGRKLVAPGLAAGESAGISKYCRNLAGERRVRATPVSSERLTKGVSV